MKWMASSLSGHIVLSEIIFGLPMLAFFLYQDSWQGTLTVAWVAYLATFIIAMSAALGTLIWFTVSAPMIKGRKDK